MKKSADSHYLSTYLYYAEYVCVYYNIFIFLLQCRWRWWQNCTAHQDRIDYTCLYKTFVGCNIIKGIFLWRCKFIFINKHTYVCICIWFKAHHSIVQMLHEYFLSRLLCLEWKANIFMNIYHPHIYVRNQVVYLYHHTHIHL